MTIASYSPPSRWGGACVDNELADERETGVRSGGVFMVACGLGSERLRGCGGLRMSGSVRMQRSPKTTLSVEQSTASDTSWESWICSSGSGAMGGPGVIY